MYLAIKLCADFNWIWKLWVSDKRPLFHKLNIVITCKSLLYHQAVFEIMANCLQFGTSGLIKRVDELLSYINAQSNLPCKILKLDFKSLKTTLKSTINSKNKVVVKYVSVLFQAKFNLAGKPTKLYFSKIFNLFKCQYRTFLLT